MDKDKLNSTITASFTEKTESLKKEIDEKLEDHRLNVEYSFDIKVPECTAEVLRRHYIMSIAKCSISTSFNDEKKMPETTLQFELHPYNIRDTLVKTKTQIDTLIREAIEINKFFSFRLVIVPRPIIPLEDIKNWLASEYPFLTCDTRERIQKGCQKWSEGKWINADEETTFLDLFFGYKAT